MTLAQNLVWFLRSDTESFGLGPFDENNNAVEILMVNKFDISDSQPDLSNLDTPYVLITATNPTEYYGYSRERKLGGFSVTVIAKDKRITGNLVQKIRQSFDNYRGRIKFYSDTNASPLDAPLDAPNIALNDVASYTSLLTTLESDEIKVDEDYYNQLFMEELVYSIITEEP